ncbi:hypothetical protein PGIGA_G00096950 [Pangasianodon gigas]|uniref:Uncharacterized protein n=1 Tax=Pangasianodon gigas TaxID=30993 RepID=A0ACC5XEH4_PANGG|nr:hypothetical protein [Pangasianodon gigas]
MVLICIRFCQKAPSLLTLSRLRTVLLCQKQTPNGWSSRSPGFYSSDLRSAAVFCSSPSPSSRLLYRLSYTGSRGNLEPIPGNSGHKAGDTLDGMPTHHRTQSHTHSRTMDNLEMPVSLQHMSLYWGRKPEYPEETPEARGEHANSTHTGRRQSSNPQPWRCETTTKPWCPPSYSSICHKTILPRHLSSAPVCIRQLPVHFPAVSGPVKEFHTSAGLRAPPAVLLWLLVKPLQKVTAIILGRSIRKWWKALPSNKRQLFREWAWQRRWHLMGVGTGLLLFISLFFLTYMEETPVTGRSRLLVFSRENFIKLTDHASDMYLEEYGNSFIPDFDPRHQVVKRVVQHLADRNRDIEGMNSVPWTVHVIEKPTVNAFAMPNGMIFVFTGMLEAVGDIHQLAFVLGHEMAHALIGHAAEQASLAHVLDLLSMILLTMIWAICPRDSLALLGQWIQGKLVEILFDRPYSRKLEAEADQVGLQLAAKACVDVRAGPVFWQQMELFDQIKEEPTMPEWISTHPSHHSRITHLDHLVPEAIELRARCGCPALPDPDPRAVFSKIAQKLLEDAEKGKNKAKREEKERERAAGTQQRVQPQLGAALAISAQQQTLLSKEDLTEIRLLHKEVEPKTNGS